MIKYSLGCNNHHRFEAWFRSGDAFDRQARRQLVVCPDCGSTEIEKAPMAPALLKSGLNSGLNSGRVSSQLPPPEVMPRPSLADLRRLRNEIMAKSENVGKDFAGEARRIHFGEAEKRSIRGEASLDDARSLIDDGVPFGLLPPLPEDQN